MAAAAILWEWVKVQCHFGIVWKGVHEFLEAFHGACVDNLSLLRKSQETLWNFQLWHYHHTLNVWWIMWIININNCNITIALIYVLVRVKRFPKMPLVKKALSSSFQLHLPLVIPYASPYTKLFYLFFWSSPQQLTNPPPQIHSKYRAPPTSTFLFPCSTTVRSRFHFSSTRRMYFACNVV